MKLRQKLAVALASAMVVTAVPVVTMADTTNKIVRATEIVEKNTKTTSGAMKMKFEDIDTAVDEEFYLTLTNAQWLEFNQDDLAASVTAGTVLSISDLAATAKADSDTAYLLGQLNMSGVTSIKYLGEKSWEYTTSQGTFTYTKQSKSVMKVTLDSFTYDHVNTPFVAFPLPVKLTGGTASVAITGEGSNTTVTEGSYTFASTGEDAASVVVGDLKSFYDNGELSPIVIKENFVGSLSQDALVLEVSLDDTDFEFLNSDVKITGSYGFNFEAKVSDGVITGSPSVEFEIAKDDPSTAYIRISGLSKGNSLGRVTITGLKVDNSEKEIEAGKLLADIKSVDQYVVSAATPTLPAVVLVGGAELDQNYTNLEVANITNYGAYIQMKDEKAVDIVAGREAEVEFTVAESVNDSFVGGRKIEITLDSEEYDDSFFWIEKEANNSDYLSLISEDARKIVKSVEVKWHDAKKVTTVGDSYRADAIVVELNTVDTDGSVQTALNRNEVSDAFKVKTTIYVPVDQKDKKELTLVADMRGINEFKSATAVNVINPFDVTFDQTTLKVGLQNQVAGKIAIAETAKEMFQKGEIILNVVKGSKDVDGITIEKAGDLTVTGDLKKADLEVKENNNQADVIDLKRQSKSASTLTIENMELTVDRTVPEGSYNLELSGDAIDIHGGVLKVEDYIVIGTPNTEDIIASNGLAKGVATFTMDQATYTLNGVEKTMDAKVYIQDPGYTMVPVRYLAEAFGVAQQDIIFGKGTVTLFAGNRTVQLTNNSDIAVVNGAQVALQTAVVIKDGRTYAPIGEIARILGVSAEWNNETKTATFENK